MDLFGLTFEQAEANFQIDKRDKEWVEEVLYYLLEVLGLPDENNQRVLLNTDSFPLTLPEKEAKIKDVIQELCLLLKLDAASISYSKYEDLLQEEAYADFLLPFEIDTLFEKDGPRIVFKTDLLSRPKKLIFLVLYELLHLRLMENTADLKPKENMGPFTTLVALYFGFEILLARNLYSTGSVNQQYWDSKWYRPGITTNVCMAYALALFTRMRQDKNLEWSVLLPPELRIFFKEAQGFAANLPIPFEQGLKFQMITQLEKSSTLYKKKEYEEAISTLEALIANHSEDPLPARVYGNLGYYLTLNGQYEKSIGYFEKAIELESDLHYVYDNLGYAFLKLGKLKKAKKHLSISLKGMKNDIAYSFRNLALYHQAKGEPDKAEEFFDLSYENKTDGVDLLDYHYAEFLLEIGKEKKSKKYLQKAVDEGEPMAIKRMEELFGAK